MAVVSSRPLTDRECQIVYASPQLGWPDEDTRAATERWRMQMVADMRRATHQPEILPIDLPAVQIEDDPRPIQAVTSRDLLLATIACACTTLGGALALWVLA
ncbi:hypothetical protein J7376_19685 [Paracoccus sp. R12_1]|uniref:hypothetical protein n=1 Tax=unclassified Paracoccus (in: a-proteobacteria) TaxID=2688777 RepID=UPI001ADB8EC9|nr:MULTISPECIES: hypothetical protein [unclassified Paracoccus (in: a-proteobacteria)]MBO9457307.1 hypothetical protein [Paracoccus sp. R12_2]MBO9488725.1 hypothetical protein [Paracoccus sp. R12_1]